jgi:hypothetical protein
MTAFVSLLAAVLPKLSLLVTAIIGLLAFLQSVRGAKSTQAELHKHNEHSNIVDKLAAIEALDVPMAKSLRRRR